MAQLALETDNISMQTEFGNNLPTTEAWIFFCNIMNSKEFGGKFQSYSLIYSCLVNWACDFFSCRNLTYSQDVQPLAVTLSMYNSTTKDSFPPPPQHRRLTLIDSYGEACPQQVHESCIPGQFLVWCVISSIIKKAHTRQFFTATITSEIGESQEFHTDNHICFKSRRQWCWRILFSDVWRLLILHLFNSVKLSYCACLKHLIV